MRSAQLAEAREEAARHLSRVLTLERDAEDQQEQSLKLLQVPILFWSWLHIRVLIANLFVLLSPANETKTMNLALSQHSIGRACRGAGSFIGL